MDYWYVAIIAVFAIAALATLVGVTLLNAVKDKAFPPCVDCAHCQFDGQYKRAYRCRKNIYKVDGSPLSCDTTRGTSKCWFKKKD